MKNLKTTLQVLASIYPFVASIFTNDPDFYTNDFINSLIVIGLLEVAYRLVSRIQQGFQD